MMPGTLHVSMLTWQEIGKVISSRDLAITERMVQFNLKLMVRKIKEYCYNCLYNMSKKLTQMIRSTRAELNKKKYYEASVSRYSTKVSLLSKAFICGPNKTHDGDQSLMTSHKFRLFGF